MIRLMSVVAAFSFVAMSQLAAAADRAADEAAIHQILKDYETLWNKHDMSTFGNLFTDDAVWVNVVGQVWHGRADIQKVHQIVHETIFKNRNMKLDDMTIRFIRPDVAEVPGKGVDAHIDGATWRLGSAEWCGVARSEDADSSEVWLSRDGQPRASFRFDDILRKDAAESVRQLRALRLPVRLLSGDRPRVVAAVARAAGIDDAQGGLLPGQKVGAVSAGRTMMVGDGVNDAPALRAAHVSMAPSSAADIGRSAADFVFTGEDLAAVPFVVTIARAASRLVNQNLAIAIGYNAVAVPLAVSGHVTPLIAAVAMSGSSLIVVANALRLRWLAREQRTAPWNPDRRVATSYSAP